MQYPKMLCKGTQVEYEYRIAQDERHESELRKDGFRHYAELPIDAEQSKTNFEEMTSDELRDLLNEKGIEFKVRDSKAALIKLLGGE